LIATAEKRLAERCRWVPSAGNSAACGLGMLQPAVPILGNADGYSFTAPVIEDT
jgi:hypothetical protein